MEKFEILKQRREELGLSVDEVAATVGTTSQHYFKVEKGHANLSDAMALKLSEIYGVQLTPCKVDYKPTPRQKREELKKTLKIEEEKKEDLLDEHHYKYLNKELKRINVILVAEVSRLYKLIDETQLHLDEVHNHIEGLFPKTEEDD